MAQPTGNNKLMWLIGGTLLGMAISSLLPTEPAFANAVDSNDKFSMCTVPTTPGNGDAIFVLDMVTGRLLGASFSTQARSFNQTYARLLAADFGVADNAQYVMVPANINLPNSGGTPPAQGAIYVGEMTTGTICAYGFPFVQGPRPVPTAELVLLAKFPFRASVK